MPTGITAIIEDKPDVTFREFALRCARGMGACISQREDSLDVPPRLEEPDTYHAEALEDARRDLDRLRGMSEQQIEAAFEAHQAEYTKYYQEAAEKAKQLAARYARMKEAVEAWQPPTPDHVNLKAFMLDQIRISTEYTSGPKYWLKELEDRNKETSAQWHADAVATAEHNVERHSQQLAEEQQRCATRNAWKQQLFESLNGA